MWYDNDLHYELTHILNKNFAGFSAGFGLKIGKDKIDYGYSDYGGLGITHHIGYTFSLNRGNVIGNGNDLTKMSPIGSKLYPRDVRAKIVKDKLLIYWKRVQNALDNVYGRYNNQESWVLLNSTPLNKNKNFIIFKKPQFNGIYS